MTRITRIGIGVALACGATMSVSSLAADTMGCSAVTFHQDFLKQYPNAPAACRDVVTKNDKKLVRFTGSVQEVKGETVTLRFLNVRDEAIASSKDLTFTPRSDLKVSVNGQKTAVKDLKKGDVLNIYIPEGTNGVVTDPEDATVTAITVK